MSLILCQKLGRGKRFLLSLFYTHENYNVEPNENYDFCHKPLV